jgi:hypothetical protein
LYEKIRQKLEQIAQMAKIGPIWPPWSLRTNSNVGSASLEKKRAIEFMKPSKFRTKTETSFLESQTAKHNHTHKVFLIKKPSQKGIPFI